MAGPRTSVRCVCVCVRYIYYSDFFLRIFIFNSKTGTIKMISYYPVPYTLCPQSCVRDYVLSFIFYCFHYTRRYHWKLDVPRESLKRVVVSLASFSFCPRLFILFLFFLWLPEVFLWPEDTASRNSHNNTLEEYVYNDCDLDFHTRLCIRTYHITYNTTYVLFMQSGNSAIYKRKDEQRNTNFYVVCV